MSSARVIAGAALAALLVGAATLPLLSRRVIPASAQPSAAAPRVVVETLRAGSRPMSRTLALTGTLQAGSDIHLSPKQGGRIVAVLVREGQNVRRGQVLVRLDPSDAKRQAEQASAGVAAARASWEKAVQGERLKRLEIENRINEARRGVEQARLQVDKAEAGAQLQNRAALADVKRAQAGVDAARSALAQARRGARPEEKRQAQIGVQQAERGAALARKNLEDLEFLLAKGAVPRVQVDEARERHQKALEGMQQAKAQLEIAEAGATPDQIAGAEAQVRSAEAALEAAKAAANRDDLQGVDLAAAKTQLRLAEQGLEAALESRAELELVRKDAAAARAAYDQAVAGSRLAGQQIDAFEIRSPIDGVATSVSGAAGEMAGPGHPLVRVVGTSGVYLEAVAVARTLRTLRPGQAASVSLDVLPGRVFPGVVREIGAAAGPDGRSFPVRIDLSAPAGVLRPGAQARAEVVVESYSDGVTVPLSALRTDDERTVVWVVRNGHVEEVPVQVPVQDASHATVRGAIRAGEPVVVSAPPGTRPGAEVEARTQSGD